jgi:hypothetical protein
MELNTHTYTHILLAQDTEKLKEDSGEQRAILVLATATHQQESQQMTYERYQIAFAYLRLSKLPLKLSPRVQTNWKQAENGILGM